MRDIIKKIASDKIRDEREASYLTNSIVRMVKDIFREFSDSKSKIPMAIRDIGMHKGWGDTSVFVQRAGDLVRVTMSFGDSLVRESPSYTQIYMFLRRADGGWEMNSRFNTTLHRLGSSMSGSKPMEFIPAGEGAKLTSPKILSQIEETIRSHMDEIGEFAISSASLIKNK